MATTKPHCPPLIHTLIRTSRRSYTLHTRPIGAMGGIELGVCLGCSTTVAEPEPAASIGAAVAAFVGGGA